MRLPAQLLRRLHCLNLPGALLLLLLQRTPVLNLLVSAEEQFGAPSAGFVLRALLPALAALGAVNTLAGATPLVPSSGTASGISVAAGSSVSVFYTVNGTQTPPMSWDIEGSIPPGLNFSGRTTPGIVNVGSLQLSGTPTSAGTYNVTLQTFQFVNGGGFSSPIYSYTITVTGSSSSPPSFTTQPSNQTVTAGSPVTFTAAASGSPTPTYQWQKGGADIPGATSSSYSIASTVAGDAGSYDVVATNSAGTTTSSIVTLTVNAATTAPAFTTQPTNQTVTAGGSVTFTAAASGNPTPTYQWQKGGVNIAGATSSSYSIASTVAGDAGSYTVVATNSAGTATSNAATLTVNAATSAPSFTTQPLSQNVTAGTSVTFTAAASGNPTPTYQWQKGGVNIAGATSSSYSIASTVAGDAGSYTVVATNSAGTATSNAATLTISAANSAPSFTTQPTDQTATVGNAVTFTAMASGVPTPTYQWQKGGVAISGATGSSYTINSVATADAGSYQVVATNAAGTATSNAVTLTVSAAASAPSFTTQPTSKSVALGGAVTFTAAASGNPTPTYQWQKGGVNISGATGSSYTIASAAAGDAGSYTVVATNASGTATSTAVTLTLTSTAGTAVSSVTATVGHNATFSAGHTAGSIQWQVSTNSGGTWTNLANDTTYSGVTGTLLTVAGVASGLNGAQYRFVATSNGVVSTSNAATLTVAPVFFPFPTGIAIDTAGNLYVADANANTVQKVNTSGQVSPLAGQSGSAGSADGTGTVARFNQPEGVALLPSGALVVTDSANATLRSVTADGAVTTLAGQAGTRGGTDGTGTAASFSQPYGLTVARDGSGTLFVADAMNDTLRKVTSTGAVTTPAGSMGVTGSADGTGGTARFNYPTGVAADNAGNIFVADTTNNLIRAVTPAGGVTTLAGLAGVSGFDDGTGIHALFNQPGGLAVDAAGNLYVADTGNSTIRKVTPAGVVTTLAGTPGIAGLEDGNGGAALFNQPKSLAIDGAGNLFVADTGNAALRKVTPDGTVSTLSLSAAPAPTPTPTPTPTPAPSGGGYGGGGGGGGGGGAPSLWFMPALFLLTLVGHARNRRRTLPH